MYLVSLIIPVSIVVNTLLRTLKLQRGVGAVPPARGSIPAPRPNAIDYDYTYFVWTNTIVMTERKLNKIANFILKRFAQLHTYTDENRSYLIFVSTASA
jgi:hypothetical protein